MTEAFKQQYVGRQQHHRRQRAVKQGCTVKRKLRIARQYHKALQTGPDKSYPGHHKPARVTTTGVKLENQVKQTRCDKTTYSKYDSQHGYGRWMFLIGEIIMRMDDNLIIVDKDNGVLGVFCAVQNILPLEIKMHLMIGAAQR